MCCEYDPHLLQVVSLAAIYFLSYPCTILASTVYTPHPLFKAATCRIIHQSWKTSEVPAAYAAWQQSWIDMHPHWHYNLWTDDMNRQ